MAEPDKNSGKEKPKIIVDDDWKSQAQAEKERLAQQVEQGAQQTGAPVAAGPAGTEERGLPPAGFAALVNSLVAQVYMALGGLEDPKTKRRMVDLELAKFHIDTLAMLEEKTAGNVTDEEKKLLDKATYETRMRYVQLAQSL